MATKQSGFQVVIINSDENVIKSYYQSGDAVCDLGGGILALMRPETPVRKDATDASTEILATEKQQETAQSAQS